MTMAKEKEERKEERSKKTKVQTKSESGEKTMTPALRREWYPHAMMTELDREFDRFRANLERAFWGGGDWNFPYRRRRPMPVRPEVRQLVTREPLMDIKDNDREVIVEVEMPGISKDNVEIDVSENSVEVCGKMETTEKEEEGDYYRRERSYSTCMRKAPLPSEIKPSEAEATMNDGVLRIRLPKKNPTKERRTRRVKVK